MASKVNTKFVAILSLTMIAGVAAVGGTLYWVKKNDATRLIRKGEEALAAGDLKTAERSFSKAVNKKQTDGPLLKRWVDILQQITPDTQTEYSERYREYVNGLRTYATIQQTDVAAHKAYLDVIYRETMFSPYNRQAHDGLIDLVDRALGFFEKGGAATNGSPELLKRYRGISRATILAQVPDQTDPKDAAAAIADLEAAVKADPTDEIALNSLVIVHTAQAMTARKRSVDLEAAEALDAARKSITAFLTNQPDSPAVQLSALELDLDEASRAAMLGKVGVAAMNAVKERRASFQTRLDPIAESIKKVGPNKIEPNTLARFMVAEAIIDPASKRARTEAVLRDMITRQPDNFFSLQLLADMLGERGETDEAIATLQKIVDLPKRKLGVEGVLLQQLQPAVVGKQARFAMLAWERAKPETRVAALTKAKDLATKYRTVAGDTPTATLLDAQIKFGEGDLSSCQKLLQTYNEATRDSDADGLWLLAQVMIRNNSSGATEKLIEKVIKLQPGNVAAHIALARVKTQLQKYDDAFGLCDRALQMDPENTEAKNIQLSIAAARGEAPVISDNPVLQTIGNAQKLIMSDKNPQAIEMLRKALPANKWDTRLAIFLVQQLSFTGDKAGALEVANETIKNNPDAAKSPLAGIRASLETADPLQGELAAIEAMSLAPLDRAIVRATSFRKYGKKEEAANELKEAAKIAPDDVKVIEMFFLQELEAKNFVECLKYVEKAEKSDLDRTGGRTFRARYLFAQGQVAEAISLMELAAKDFALTADTWRVLARMQSTAGRGSDALASYVKALALRPDDVTLINENIVLLQNLGRLDDALSLARDNFKYGQNDRAFSSIYLELEGQVGDKAKALDSRKRMLTRNPKDRSNRMAICWLMLDLKQFDEARTLIDELRKEEPQSIEALVLDARYFADRGDFSSARNLFARHINEIPRDKLTSDPYASFARMMFQYQQNDAAFAALEQGRRYQDPKLMEVDRMVADNATRLRRPDISESALRRVIDADADTAEQTYLRRLIENLNSQQKFADAHTLLDKLKSGGDKDLVPVLLAADTARGLKDDKKAQELIDRAKTNFPNDPRVWVKSAQNNMSRPELAADAEADLNRAVQIDPRNPQLYEIRGGFLISHDKVTEGIADFQKAVGLNPGLASLRLTLIRELIRRDRGAEALTLGEDALKSRGNDVQLALDMADVFMEGRQGAYAARFYKQAWDLNKTPALTQRYLDCLLNTDPPLLSDAERVLKDRAGDIERSPELRLARAKLQWRRGRMDDARRDLRGALDLISPEQGDVVLRWYGELNRIYPKSADRSRQLDQFERETTVGGIKDWLLLLRAMALTEEEVTRSQGLGLLKEVQSRTKSDAIQLVSAQQLSVSYYINKQYAESVDVLEKAVVKFPDDWELNNNVAFTLANNLDRAKDALPYAEKAAALRPDNVDSLDTLGAVYLKNGNLDKAEETLKRAVQTPGRLAGQTSALMHLCKTLIAKKNFSEAQKILADLDSVAKSQASGFPEEQKKELEALRAEASSPQSR